MTTPPNVLTFWAQAHWGTGYGVIDADHKWPGHKGLDAGLFHGRVEVPALYAGEVVAVEENPNVGHYVQVERIGGLFDTYCHIVPGIDVGAKVLRGTDLGRQAITQQEGGRQWRGQHTHLALSDTPGGWGTWGPHNFDPTPGVIAVLTGTASTAGETLISNRPKDDDMPLLYDVPQPVAAAAKTYPRQHILVYGDGRNFPFNGGDDFIAKVEAQTGPSIASDAAFVAAHIASLKATAPAVGTVTLDPGVLQAIGQVQAILAKGLTINGTAVPAK